MSGRCVVLALRGAAAIVVLTTLVGGIPRVVQAALAVTFGAVDRAGRRAAGGRSGDATSRSSRSSELAIGAALGMIGGDAAARGGDRGAARRHRGDRRAQGPYATLFGVLAAAVFVGIDGHVAVITAIVDSHRALAGDRGGAAGGARRARRARPAAVRLAVPWLVTAAVVQIAVGAGVRVAGRAGRARAGCGGGAGGARDDDREPGFDARDRDRGAGTQCCVKC